MSDGVKFIRVRGRIVPIRSKQESDSGLKKTARAAGVASRVAGVATAFGAAGYAAKKFGMKANEYLSQVPKLKKDASRLAEASEAYWNSPSVKKKSLKGMQIAQSFADDSLKALSKASKLEKVGKALGKVSAAFGHVSNRKFTYAGHLIAAGIGLGFLGMRKSKQK